LRRGKGGRTPSSDGGRGCKNLCSNHQTLPSSSEKKGEGKEKKNWGKRRRVGKLRKEGRRRGTKVVQREVESRTPSIRRPRSNSFFEGEGGEKKPEKETGRLRRREKKQREEGDLRRVGAVKRSCTGLLIPHPMMKRGGKASESPIRRKKYKRKVVHGGKGGLSVHPLLWGLGKKRKS